MCNLSRSLLGEAEFHGVLQDEVVGHRQLHAVAEELTDENAVVVAHLAPALGGVHGCFFILREATGESAAAIEDAFVGSNRAQLRAHLHLFAITAREG